MDSRVDFSVVILQLLPRVGLEQNGEVPVILLLEAVRRSVLCGVVKLAKELNKPIRSLSGKLTKKTKKWVHSVLYGRWPHSNCGRLLQLFAVDKHILVEADVWRNPKNPNVDKLTTS